MTTVSKFNEMHRQIVLTSIANAQGLTEQTSTQDLNDVVRSLMPGYTDNTDNLSVESILEYVYTTHKGDLDKIESLVGEAAEILAEEYGMQMPMPADTIAHETNDPDEYFLAKLRNRIVVMDMEPLIEKVSFYKEYVVENKLRDMNHIEDLILEDGINGLQTAIKILRSFAEGKAHTKTTVKWDGSPAIVFGRDKSGQFFLTDKTGYAAKTSDGIARSADELKQVFANRKPVMDAERQEFVGRMHSIFDLYKAATPPDFRGTLSGDLMYFTTPPNLTFKPNVVEYKIDPASELGKRVAASTTGVVVHNYRGDQYNSAEDAIKQIQGPEVLVIPPTHVQQPSNIDIGPVAEVEAYIKKHSKEIEALFNPSGLKGIANMHQLFYRYINNSVDTGLEKLGTDFEQWLNTVDLTDKKRMNIQKYLAANAKGVNALWTLVKSIMKLKDYIVTEFDSHQGDVQQSINGQPGGEGYVVKTKKGPVKLVSRGKFTAANRAANR